MTPRHEVGASRRSLLHQLPKRSKLAAARSARPTLKRVRVHTVTASHSPREVDVDITKDTKVSDILREYGDIAEVMEVFGIKRVAGYNLRKFITKALTVERAAKVHRVPVDEFLATLRTAVGQIPPT